jgi:hypothetical protein
MCFGMGLEGLRVRYLGPLDPFCRLCDQWEVRGLALESL